VKILYLSTELQGHNIPVLERLATGYDATVEVFHWTQNKLTPFIPSEHTSHPKIRFHDRSAYSSEQIAVFAANFAPSLVYVTGWMDKGYFPTLKKLKSMGIPVVAGLDGQWTGTMRKHLACLVMQCFYKKPYYNYIWVPGPLQYEFAARLGFKKTEIIYNLLSGNTRLFSQAAQTLETVKKVKYPSKFLYVGRFADTKGVDILMEAFEVYKAQYSGTWGLSCIGNGPMLDRLKRAINKHPEIETERFMPQPMLVDRAAQAGAFILPSRYEPWGVVVHEFASAGLPLILSEHVGARQQYLIDGFNGYTFHKDSAQARALSMHLISSASNDDLLSMGKHSVQLASQTSPDITAASLMSVLKQKYLS
jgi:glycosyltransferase involved in cell wall biosynthesis